MLALQEALPRTIRTFLRCMLHYGAYYKRICYYFNSAAIRMSIMFSFGFYFFYSEVGSWKFRRLLKISYRFWLRIWREYCSLFFLKSSSSLNISPINYNNIQMDYFNTAILIFKTPLVLLAFQLGKNYFFTMETYFLLVLIKKIEKHPLIRLNYWFNIWNFWSFLDLSLIDFWFIVVDYNFVTDSDFPTFFVADDDAAGGTTCGRWVAIISACARLASVDKKVIPPTNFRWDQRF